MPPISFFFILLVGILFSVAVEDKSHIRGHCQLPLHHGIQKCTNKSSIRFHMDVETEICLAFKYSGCGGNANNFETYSECMQCLPEDYSTCPAASKIVPSKNGSKICGGMDHGECDGPNTYCSNGAFFGICCDKTIRDKVNADYAKDCGPNKKKAEFTFSGFDMTLLGKTCDSKFCPEKTTCHQGNYYAYCC